MQRVIVDLLSNKMTARAMKYEKAVTISLILVFLMWPLSYVLNESVMSYFVFPITVIIGLTWGFKYKYSIKYDTIGKIIFESDKIIIEKIEENHVFKIDCLKNFIFLYNGYENEAYIDLSSTRRIIKNSEGNENTITFDYNGKSYKFRFFLKNKSIRNFLNKLIMNYSLNGSDLKVELGENFIEY